MRASEFSEHLSPFGALINKHALSSTYKALQLSPGHVRGCSAYGAMEIEVATGLESEVYVDGDDLLQVLRSLPAADLELQAADGSLRWKCGAARGQLALLGEKVVIPPPAWPEGVELVEVGDDFARRLELGSLGCGSVALLSVGLYGVTIANREGGTSAYSSDNMTMASARLGDRMAGAPESMCLSPDAVRLIGLLSGRGRLSAQFDDTSLYLRTPDARCVIKQVPPLKFDLPKNISSFLTQEVKLGLDRDVVAAFIRRAEALAEEKGKASVALSVSGGAVRLAFSEGRSTTEEYYLAEGPEGDIAPIGVDARRLARALARASHVVFDHAARGALVLRGEGEFVYVVSGKKVEA